MEIIDNINQLLGDNLKKAIAPDAMLQIAAANFSIYAHEAPKKELEQIESRYFICTSPTFVPSEVAEKFKKEHRETHIPNLTQERSLHVTEIEVRLRDTLTLEASATISLTSVSKGERSHRAVDLLGRVYDWNGARKIAKESPRGERLGAYKFGVPPKGNANFAWVQHFTHHLAPQGMAA